MSYILMLSGVMMWEGRLAHTLFSTIPPLFAAEDWHVWAASMLGALPSIGLGMAWLLTWWSKRRKTTLEEWQDIVRWSSQQLEDQKKQITAYQEHHSRCQRHLVYLHGVVTHQAQAMRQNGMATEAVKPLSEFIPEDGDDDLEAQTRHVQQNTALIQAMTKKVVPDVSNHVVPLPPPQPPTVSKEGAADIVGPT